LREIDQQASSMRFQGARLGVNPPLAFLSHRGNLYILRRKLEGIHLEEALDQLNGAPHLLHMNAMARIDRSILGVTRSVREWLASTAPPEMRAEAEDLTIFVPWDLERNSPRVLVEPCGVSIDKLWLA
jgi:hypothetical protein